MAESDRRSFLKATGAALAGAALGTAGCAPGEDAPGRGADSGSRVLSADVLRGVATVVLPVSALGPDGVEEAVQAFEAWVEGFEPVAELEHGYGTSQIRYGPPDPAPGWQAQLEGLEIESRHRFEMSFLALSLEERRSLLAGQLSGAGDGLPGPSGAPHVVLGLLGHFYDSPIATDLCYERIIRKETCRGIPGVTELPAPLDGAVSTAAQGGAQGAGQGTAGARRPLRMASASRTAHPVHISPRSGIDHLRGS